jgi:hypothetical protein
VPEDDARLRRGPTLVHVEVGPTDTRCSDVDDDIVRVFEFWFLYFLDGHLVWPLVDDCLH